MKISSKGRYAVRIMAEIAKCSNLCISVSDISEKQNITIKYTEQIINKLVKNKLLVSFRGVNGGYTLAKPANEITIAEILKVTNDTPTLAPCLSENKDCPRKNECVSIGCWENLNKLIFDYLSSITLQDIINQNYKNL